MLKLNGNCVQWISLSTKKIGVDLYKCDTVVINVLKCLSCLNERHIPSLTSRPYSLSWKFSSSVILSFIFHSFIQYIFVEILLCSISCASLWRSKVKVR